MVSERRSYFRIEEDIILEHKSIDTYTVKQGEPEAVFPPSAVNLLYSQWRKLDGEAHKVFSAIAERDRSLADYLSILDKKFELLSQHLVATQHRQECDAKPTQVNLSEGGLSFSADKAIYKGSYLAIRLTFLPSYQSVVVFAKVIRCEPNKGTNTGKGREEESHNVAVKLIGLQEQQRQFLAKQIIQFQMMAKRKAKNTAEQGDNTKPANNTTKQGKGQQAKD